MRLRSIERVAWGRSLTVGLLLRAEPRAAGTLARQARSCLPVRSTGTSCRRGSSPTVSVSSCATPRRRIDTRTVSPGRRRWTASSRRLGPVTATPSNDSSSSPRSRPATYIGESSTVGTAIRGVPLPKSSDTSPIQGRPGIALAKHQAGARQERRVVDDLATLNEPIEEIVRECAIAGDLGEHTPQILHGVRARNRPFNRRCRTPELLPHPAHVVVQRHLVIGAGPQRQIEAEADDGAPVVVRDEVVVDIRRVDPDGRIHELGEPADLFGASVLTRGTPNHEIERIAQAPGKFIDARRDRPAA